MRVIGEAQQQWAPLRRKYNLFTYHHSPNQATEMGTQKIPLEQTGLSNAQQMQIAHTAEGYRDFGEFSQFAYVDEPFLSWDFSLRSADSRLIGSVNRDFVGFAREIFTDTGVYALRMDSAALKALLCLRLLSALILTTLVDTAALVELDSSRCGSPVLVGTSQPVAPLAVLPPAKLEL
jgi:hypothetical protein